MISMRLRRLYFRLSYLTGFPRNFRPGMQGLIPFSSKTSLNQSASYPRAPSIHCAAERMPRRAAAGGVITDLPRRHEEAQRTSVLIRDGMQLRVHTPFFSPRLEAVRSALR